MRYLIIRYLRQPSGKINEEIQVAKQLRPRDLQTGTVILDFKNLVVIKASLDGATVPKDFQRICEYYYQYYRDTIDQLLAAHGRQVMSAPAKDPDKAQEPAQ